MDQQSNSQTPDDLRAKDILSARLAEGPGLEDVRAWVQDGVATITGRVRDDVDSLRVHKIARNVPGVIEIKDMLKVDPTYSPPEKTIQEVLLSGEPELQHPTVDIPTEVNNPGRVTPDDVDVVNVAPVEGMPAAVVPVSGSPASVMDAGAVDAMKVSGSAPSADDLALHILEQMHVVDSEGKTVGKVKTIRQTDFLLNRPWARDVYVPYFECELQEDHLRFKKVKSHEIDEQGWAISAPFK